MPGIDLIVGGHTHTFLYNGSTGPVLDLTTNASDVPMGPYPTYVASNVR